MGAQEHMTKHFKTFKTSSTCMKSTKCGSLQKPHLSCLMHWSLVDLEESHRDHPNLTATDPKRWKEDWDAFVSSAFGLDPIFFAASVREEPLERRHIRQRTRKCNMWQEGLSFAFGENVAIANIARAKTNAKPDVRNNAKRRASLCGKSLNKKDITPA